MDWKEFFKPSKKKIIISLIPFIFHMFFYLMIPIINILPRTLGEIISTILVIPVLVLYFPFSPLLKSMGLIESGFLGGPTFLGTLLIDLIYFILIYISVSLITKLRK
jgi:hypothetical protein